MSEQLPVDQTDLDNIFKQLNDLLRNDNIYFLDSEQLMMLVINNCNIKNYSCLFIEIPNVKLYSVK